MVDRILDVYVFLKFNTKNCSKEKFKAGSLFYKWSQSYGKILNKNLT